MPGDELAWTGPSTAGPGFCRQIVVLSAFLNEENVRAYQALGVDLMLAKPFDLDELRHAMDILADEAPVYAHRATG